MLTVTFGSVVLLESSLGSVKHIGELGMVGEVYEAPHDWSLFVLCRTDT
jgi:hypothetical protein